MMLAAGIGTNIKLFKEPYYFNIFQMHVFLCILIVYLKSGIKLLRK